MTLIKIQLNFMKNISRKIVVCLIACFVITAFSSCDKVAKKAYKEVAEEFVEEGAEKGSKKAYKEAVEEFAEEGGEKGTKKGSQKLLKQIDGRPLPDNSTALTDIGRKKMQRETGLSANACKHIRTEEQVAVFKELRLKDFDVPATTIKGIDVPGRNVKFPKDLPLKTKLKDMPGAKELMEKQGRNWDEIKEWNNLDLMGNGNNPIFPADRKRGLPTEIAEVHHDNQTHCSNYTIMRKSIHNKNNGILHDKGKSEIDRGHFNSYERPAMLSQLVEVLKERYNGWGNIPPKLF